MTVGSRLSIDFVVVFDIATTANDRTSTIRTVARLIKVPEGRIVSVYEEDSIGQVRY